jgi:H+/Cl- antiporter ClcA
LGCARRSPVGLISSSIVRPLVGGILFGLIGVALPLTLFTGDSALTTVISDGTVLGAGLLVAVVFAKILTFALCQATGFIGGPFFVSLFIGGTAGTALHLLIPGLPDALCVTAMMAALPGALVAAPFSLLLLTVLVTQIGTLETAPVAMAVLTAYLAVSSSGVLMALMRKGQNAAPPDAPPAKQPAPSAPLRGCAVSIPLRIVETDYCEVPSEDLLGVGRFDPDRTRRGRP